MGLPFCDWALLQQQAPGKNKGKIVRVLCLSWLSSGKPLKQMTEISRGRLLCYSPGEQQEEAVMIVISLALASVGLFGAHVLDLYQDARPAVVPITGMRSSMTNKNRRR